MATGPSSTSSSRGEHRGRPPDPHVRPRAARPPGPAGGVPRGVRDHPRPLMAAARPTTSSPTSGRCSASSSAIPTGSSVSVASRTPTSPASSIHPGRLRPLLLSRLGRRQRGPGSGRRRGDQELKARYFRTMDTKDWAGCAGCSPTTSSWTPRSRAAGSSPAPIPSCRSSRRRSTVRSRCTTATCPRSNLRRPTTARASGRCKISSCGRTGRGHGAGHYHETYEGRLGRVAHRVVDAHPPAHRRDISPPGPRARIVGGVARPTGTMIVPPGDRHPPVDAAGDLELPQDPPGRHRQTEDRALQRRGEDDVVDQGDATGGISRYVGVPLDRGRPAFMATTSPGIVPVFPPKYSVWFGDSVSGVFSAATNTVPWRTPGESAPRRTCRAGSRSGR